MVLPTRRAGENDNGSRAQTAAGEPPSLAMRSATARGPYSYRQRSFIFALFGSLGEPELGPNPYRASN